jgi:hypothetical protein
VNNKKFNQRNFFSFFKFPEFLVECISESLLIRGSNEKYSKAGSIGKGLLTYVIDKIGTSTEDRVFERVFADSK